MVVPEVPRHSACVSGWLWAHSEAVLWFRCEYDKFGNCHRNSDSHDFYGSKVGLCLNLENFWIGFLSTASAVCLLFLHSCVEVAVQKWPVVWHGRLDWLLPIHIWGYLRVRWYWISGRGSWRCFVSQTGQGSCLYRNCKTCFLRVWK